MNKHIEDIKDIFLTEEYFQLSQFNNEGTYECFYFNDGEKYAFYPYLKNEILGFDSISSEVYFDIQSAYGYCGIVSNSGQEGFIRSFYDRFDTYCIENNIVAEFVRFHPILENSEFSSKEMTVIEDRETVYVDLTLSHDEIFKNQYTSKGRNVIRKAHKLDYTCEFIKNPNNLLISQFYHIYTQNMRYVNAEDFYFFSKDYFSQLFKLFPKSAYLGLVYDEEKRIICATIFLHHKDFYHYHLSGRLIETDNSVNNFMIDEAVKHGISLGAKYFHLGGGRTNDKKDRLLKFKSSFSKNRGIFKIGKRVHNQHIYDSLVDEWSMNNPDKVETYRNHLLKYRF